MKSLTFTSALLFSFFIFSSCGDNDSKSSKETSSSQATENSADKETHGKEIKPEDVKLTTPLNKEWVKNGKSTYELKCQGCHKLNSERVVGPGWKGVTKKREPHWIMNMITNVDMMLEKDTAAQNLLEQCLVRMPNQNISTDQAREVLEFMRSNDGEK